MTIPKPAHLGPEYAAQFQDRSVVAAYRHRPPYPPEAFDILGGLLAGRRRAVLDLGCGTGDIARPLARMVDRVDAVDFSPEMISAGRAAPGGGDPRLRWIVGRAEEVPLQPPYALITAGSSLHWMDWETVLPRCRDALAPGDYLALVSIETLPSPWDAELSATIRRFSTNREYQPYDLVEELARRGLFRQAGEQATAAVPFAQPVADYIEAFHSMNGLSRERMDQAAAGGFDAAVAAAVAPFCPDGLVRLLVAGRVVWGRPRRN
ncbi:MAG: class I SAM-dependent methyltransferase [Chloroflexia bacterium]